MVVHISADRSNATVMSIPRDTETDVPSCTNPKTGASTPGYHGMINSALAYGQACQATVHKLTDILINHFVQVDFSGVVNMSDAVGGVSACVDANVYDTEPHRKLSQGTYFKGVAALEFLRSRHGFGDGSDLGRTYAQHIYLSSLIRKFGNSAGTLTNPTALYHLADAATKALTVDTGLGSVSKLIWPGQGPQEGALQADHLHHHADRGRPRRRQPGRRRRGREDALRHHRRRPVADHGDGCDLGGGRLRDRRPHRYCNTRSEDHRAGAERHRDLRLGLDRGRDPDRQGFQPGDRGRQRLRPPRPPRP